MDLISKEVFYLKDNQIKKGVVVHTVDVKTLKEDGKIEERQEVFIDDHTQMNNRRTPDTVFLKREDLVAKLMDDSKGLLTKIAVENTSAVNDGSVKTASAKS